MKREWIRGDVFTTTFWGSPEVCIIQRISSEYTFFVRLESIRKFETIKKDYCGAGLENNLFKRIQKTFIHHSTWYSDYKLNSKEEQERSVAT